MSTVYCAALSELREDIAQNGLRPENGGFYLLSAFPDDIDAEFDVWVVDLKDASIQGDVIMVCEPIPAHDLQLAPDYRAGMAI